MVIFSIEGSTNLVQAQLDLSGRGRKPPSARTTSTSSRNSSIDRYVLPKELDEKVATLHFPALGEVLTVLAREHADYTGVKVEGPFKGEHHQY